MPDVRTILKMKKPFWGALKQYNKCYNIICHFKPRSLNVYQIIIFPYFISVHMKYQLVFSKWGIFETIYYHIVTSYSLSTDQCFLNNQFVSSKNGTDFSWYSKCGGKNSGLKVIFHLKENYVRIFYPSLTSLVLNTEFVYADGYSTPFMTISSMKEQKSSRASKILLYRLVDSYCIISLHYYCIISGILFVFVWFLGTVLCGDLYIVPV